MNKYCVFKEDMKDGKEVVFKKDEKVEITDEDKDIYYLNEFMNGELKCTNGVMKGLEGIVFDVVVIK